MSFLFACKSIDLSTIPRYQQSSIDLKEFITKDSIRFKIANPLMCPVQIVLHSDDEILNQKFDTVILAPKIDTGFSIKNRNERVKLSYSLNLGDKRMKVKNEKLQLPFSRGRKVRIIQGNNGDYSHNTVGSKYAVDFALQANDTIKSAGNGFVVGVIQDYNIQE